MALMTELMPRTEVRYSSNAGHHLAFLNGDRIAQDLGFKPNPSLSETFAACLADSYPDVARPAGSGRPYAVEPVSLATKAAAFCRLSSCWSSTSLCCSARSEAFRSRPV